MLIVAFQPERVTPHWPSRMVAVELGRGAKYPPLGALTGMWKHNPSGAQIGLFWSWLVSVPRRASCSVRQACCPCSASGLTTTALPRCLIQAAAFFPFCQSHSPTVLQLGCFLDDTGPMASVEARSG